MCPGRDSLLTPLLRLERVSLCPCPKGMGGRHLSPARPWDSPWTSTLTPTPATTCMRRRRADAPVATPGGPADTSSPAHCGTGRMAEPRLDGARAGRLQLSHTHTHTHTRPCGHRGARTHSRAPRARVHKPCRLPPSPEGRGLLSSRDYGRKNAEGWV